MTFKELLHSCESELVLLVALAVALLIAWKVISVFIAGARWRAANAGQAPAAAQKASGGGKGVRVVINGHLVSAASFSLNGVDDQTAALLLAIVASDSGIPLQELQFKSITSIE